MRLAQRVDRRITTFVVLNLLDYILTSIIIGYGMGVEGNLLLGQSIYSIGVTKLSATILVLLLLPYRSRLFTGLNVGLSVVVLWNVFVILIS